jgi:hypothetical protein
VSVMSRDVTIVPADMQRRARRIAAQATKLADQARPITTTATVRAKESAASAAEWAKPRVDVARAWMAVRAYEGSAAVQKKVAPKVSAMMADAAKKLDPPKRRSRLVPTILAGASLLAAGAAAAGAMMARNKRMTDTMPPPPPMPARTPSAGQQNMADSPTESGRRSRESDVNGLSR